ncbi:MAG TPA: GGDEF domain-containing protein [Acidimicrobiia bacterium]|nr:GGDEF domain-containing protein [Acidimicrobiia bacterium]
MKWGFLSTTFSLIASLATTTSLFFGVIFVSVVLGCITVASCAGTTMLLYRSSTQPHSLTPSHIYSTIAKGKSEPVPHSQEQVNAESARATPSVEFSDSNRDEESGLLSKTFFPLYLEQRVSAARRTLSPVSLVIFELDGLDKNDSNSPTDQNFYISAVGDVVKQTLRESDCAFRIDANIFAAVMDDTTESGAVWAAERVRGVLHTGALAGRVTVSAGVACYPSHALEANELIACANKALLAAKARGVDQVEIAVEQ